MNKDLLNLKLRIATLEAELAKAYAEHCEAKVEIDEEPFTKQEFMQAEVDLAPDSPLSKMIRELAALA